jgi:hypothetical protein
MGFRLKHDVVYRTTTLYGYSGVGLTERAVDGAWELAAGVPRDAALITADEARERLGAALADEPSRFGQPPPAGEPGGGIHVRTAQLDAMIAQTLAWVRAAAVGIDNELDWVSQGSWDHDYEMDKSAAVDDAVRLLHEMVDQRARIVARTEMRRSEHGRDD